MARSAARLAVAPISSLRDMVRGMSRAVAVGLRDDTHFARSLAVRVVEPAAHKRYDEFLDWIFRFAREGDGGALAGETLTGPVVFSYDAEPRAAKPEPTGAARIVRPGGVVETWRAGRVVRVESARLEGPALRLPARPWRGIKYIRELRGLDTYASLARTVEAGGGDCDDSAVAIITLAKTLGFECGFKIVSQSGVAWEHVYAVVGYPLGAKPWRGEGKWIALDTTDKRFGPGDDPAEILRMPDGQPLKSEVHVA